jgi:hypothetical protein
MSGGKQRKAAMCGRKFVHKSEESARRHADRLWERDKTVMAIYPCPFCGGWHVGHPVPGKGLNGRDPNQKKGG